MKIKHQRGIEKLVDDASRKIRYTLGLPIRGYKNTTLPWGYRLVPPDLIPIPEDFILLIQAKRHLHGCSLASIAEWLTAKSGNPISAEGLRKLMLNRPPDDRIQTLTEEERENLI